MERQPDTRSRPAAPWTFGQVVCGINATAEAVEAARQAALIAPPSASMVLVTAVDPIDRLWDAEPYSAIETAARVEKDAEELLGRTRESIGPGRAVDTRVVEAPVTEALLGELDPGANCLLALGPPARGRITGILCGAAATELLHTAPCSVLVARMPDEPQAFPRSIVVGLDGSPQSAAAYALAEPLAERLGVDPRPLVALGGKGVDLQEVQRIVRARQVETDERPPVPALAAAVDEDDLLVVGSRGLHGLGALGSTSEQVAHRAPCSVLVVRI